MSTDNIFQYINSTEHENIHKEEDSVTALYEIFMKQLLQYILETTKFGGQSDWIVELLILSS